MRVRYLLDTNVLINHQRGLFNLATYLKEHGIRLDDCCISEITWVEMLIGERIMRHRGMRNKISSMDILSMFKVIPISNCLNMFVEEKCRLQFAGTPLENNFDLLIGCTGVVNDMIVVTDNIKDFKNIEGIRLESWS